MKLMCFRKVSRIYQLVDIYKYVAHSFKTQSYYSNWPSDGFLQYYLVVEQMRGNAAGVFFSCITLLDLMQKLRISWIQPRFRRMNSAIRVQLPNFDHQAVGPTTTLPASARAGHFLSRHFQIALLIRLSPRPTFMCYQPPPPNHPAIVSSRMPPQEMVQSFWNCDSFEAKNIPQLMTTGLHILVLAVLQ